MIRIDPYLWRMMKCIPVIFILWHINNAITYGPGTVYLTLWILEAIWIALYAIALLVLFSPTPGGYWYLTVLISLNLARELWISYLVLDEQRLMNYLTSIVLLILLYYYRDRFGAKNFRRQ